MGIIKILVDPSAGNLSGNINRFLGQPDVDVNHVSLGRLRAEVNRAISGQASVTVTLIKDPAQQITGLLLNVSAEERIVILRKPLSAGIIAVSEPETALVVSGIVSAIFNIDPFMYFARPGLEIISDPSFNGIHARFMTENSQAVGHIEILKQPSPDDPQQAGPALFTSIPGGAGPLTLDVKAVQNGKESDSPVVHISSVMIQGGELIMNMAMPDGTAMSKRWVFNDPLKPCQRLFVGSSLRLYYDAELTDFTGVQ